MADSKAVGEALLPFVLDGRFPESIDSLPSLSHTDLGPAIRELEKAKTGLKNQIHAVNQETSGPVASWERNAKALQEDIIRSKTLANDIIRQSEAPQASGEAIEIAEERADFLNQEVQYSQQLFGVLKGLRHVSQQLDEAERATTEKRIQDSLRLLEKSRSDLDKLGISKAVRVVKLLDIRIFELGSRVHGVFAHVWKELVQVDVPGGRIDISEHIDDSQMTLSDAFAGLKTFKEVDEHMEQLWHNIDTAIFTPRMNVDTVAFAHVHIEGNALKLAGETDHSVSALIKDLGVIFEFLAARLPSELLESLSSFMMDDVISKLLSNWLTPAVPSTLSGISSFDRLIEEGRELTTLLQDRGYSSIDALKHWVDNAPAIWLGKCRETALDTIRKNLASGIGQPKQVEKIEKQMVSLQEGKELATTGAGANAETNDWGDAWGDTWDDDAEEPQDEQKMEAVPKSIEAMKQDDDDGADAWGWDEDEPATTEGLEHPKTSSKQDDDEDDSAAAWGWGDEEEVEVQPAQSTTKPSKTSKPQLENETRELIMKETYHISSMPEPVLELILAILEDGARLTRGENEYAHVASTAPGLFNLPTLILALFRAVSPHYYSLDGGGNMFLYNDAMYLAEQLSNLSTTWKEREDLTPRAKAMLRLENDVKSLQSFANRSYANEMSVQRTVLRDLIGGAQSPKDHDEWTSAVEAGTSRVRAVAISWEPILSRSVWTQAVGSLVDALAVKLITDVLEMSSISQDDAYAIAKQIASASELDDLFLPSKLSGQEPPTDGEPEVARTAQYAPNWLRLRFLSEFLQSNLNDVKFLWLESELSFYFTAEEVVDMVKASFERNERTRQLIREIEGNPRPKG